MLAKTLHTFFAIKTEFKRMKVYASVRASIDTTGERAQELSERMNNLRVTLQTARSTFETNNQ